MSGSQDNIEKNFFLIRMNSQNAMPGFMSTSYMGKLEDVTEDGVILSEVCQFLETASKGKGKDGKEVLLIDMQYCTNSMVSNGSLRFPKSAISFSRDVGSDDELLKGYNDSFEALRLDKLNIKRVSNLHGVSPAGQA